MAIGVELVNRPGLVLLDDPFAGLQWQDAEKVSAGEKRCMLWYLLGCSEMIFIIVMLQCNVYIVYMSLYKICSVLYIQLVLLLLLLLLLLCIQYR